MEITAQSAQSALTARQVEILTLIRGGKKNLEIAREIKISEKTVKAHVTAIFRALGVRNRTEAALADVPLAGEELKAFERPLYLQLFLSRSGQFQLRCTPGGGRLWIRLFSLNAGQVEELYTAGWTVVRETSLDVSGGEE